MPKLISLALLLASSSLFLCSCGVYEAVHDYNPSDGTSVLLLTNPVTAITGIGPFLPDQHPGPPKLPEDPELIRERATYATSPSQAAEVDAAMKRAFGSRRGRVLAEDQGGPIVRAARLQERGCGRHRLHLPRSQLPIRGENWRCGSLCPSQSQPPSPGRIEVRRPKSAVTIKNHMRSMTGYGRGTATLEGRQIAVELSSVNRKQAEISLSLPRALLELEPRVRDDINAHISRGGSPSSSGSTPRGGGRGGAINLRAAKAYRIELEALRKSLKLVGEITLDQVLRGTGRP